MHSLFPFFLNKLRKSITLGSALTLRLALLIISFKCSLKFNFVSTLIPSNFLYSLFLMFASSSLIVISSFLFTRTWHLLTLTFIRLSENHLNNITESCSSDWMASSIAFAVLYGALSLHNLQSQFRSLWKIGNTWRCWTIKVWEWIAVVHQTKFPSKDCITSFCSVLSVC